LSHLTTEEKEDLAHTIGATSRRMDNLFSCSFGYTMGLYQSPTYVPLPPPSCPSSSSSSSPSSATVNEASNETLNEKFEEYAQLFISFYPPLLRSSTVKKFLVGFGKFPSTSPTPSWYNCDCQSIN
jgi:UDPglucose--hexose-1-phosphate uridylyltransferase